VYPLTLLIALTLAIAPRTTYAAEPAPDLATGIGQMVVGLGAVIAILLVSLWLIKRLAAPRGAAAGLKVLGAVSVGSRERVVLIKVAEKVLVVGVSSASVSTLHTLGAAELQDSDLPPVPPAGNDFSRWLKFSMERRKDAQ
jgi:flagellar protein FliO/FliZ